MNREESPAATIHAGMQIGRKQPGVPPTVPLLAIVVAMRIRYARANSVGSGSDLVRRGLRGSGSVVTGALLAVLGSDAGRCQGCEPQRLEEDD